MNNRWGNFQNFMDDFRQLAYNPAQFAMTKMGVSKDMANDPDAIIQQMMSNGQLSQAQYNVARQTAMKIQSNPMFRQMLKN